MEINILFLLYVLYLIIIACDLDTKIYYKIFCYRKITELSMQINPFYLDLFSIIFLQIVNASARLSITNNSHICLEFSELCTRFFAEPNAPAGKPNDLVFMNCSHKQAPSFAVPLENRKFFF